jgi:transposase
MPPSTHSGRIEQLIEKMGCKLLYLPPYSPDLNKIEQRRVKVKESHPQKTGSVGLFTFWRSRMSYALRPAPTKAVAILRKFYLRKSAISQKLIERH